MTQSAGSKWKSEVRWLTDEATLKNR